MILVVELFFSSDLDGGLVSAQVVIDDGEVATGGVVDPQQTLNYVPPQTNVPLSWGGEGREGGGEGELTL